jgi:hypothetical protein
MPGYKPAEMGHGPHSSKIFVLFYTLFVLCRSVYCLCVKCVLYYCHRVATQLQLTNISYILYHISYILYLISYILYLITQSHRNWTECSTASEGCAVTNRRQITVRINVHKLWKSARRCYPHADENMLCVCKHSLITDAVRACDRLG